MKRLVSFLAGAAALGALVPAVPATQPASAASVDVNRKVEAVVMTGQQLPTWSRAPAQGLANPYPCGSGDGGRGLPDPGIPGCDVSGSFRDAHNGTLTVPPDPLGRTGVPVNEMTGYRWNGAGWTEVPIQVDQRFPYFLANARSNFAFYSGTDEELTYQWDQEAWKKIYGTCDARYADPTLGEKDPSSYAGTPASQDPVPTFDDDDELSFYYSESGAQAPADAAAPHGTILTDPAQPGFQPRQEIQLVDPLTGQSSYVYLFLTKQGPSFNASNGYVHYQRDANADEWVDRYSFPNGGTENIGSSNTGYGPNLQGTVCRTATVADGSDPNRQTPDGTPRSSKDRFPRDGMTVSTSTYQLHASGRWMVRSTQVAKPGQPGNYGVDLIDRWKGRAFQQSPDSNISLVGFEDEQVNWEANSALLGERVGPVRAIREIWGADSGTNVTKTEYYYRDYYVFRYHLRVHPIPPDGLYTSWDNNAGAVTRYYDQGMTDRGQVGPDGKPGVAIDGQNDDVGNLDQQIAGKNTYFDVTDPTFAEPLSFFNWEEVSGSNGSLVYMYQLNDVKAASEPLIIPYYRDDACFDDGTGDNPVPRPWPGEASTDSRVQAGYSAENGGTSYGQLTCAQKQGAWGQHGIHYLFTSDTDNATAPKATTEIDGQQYVWAVPTNAETNVGEQYANTVKFAVLPIVNAQSSNPGPKATSVSNTGATGGEIGNQVTLSAHLTDEDGAPVKGGTISFSLDDQVMGTATTNQNGDASLQATVPGPQRQATLTESFAGDTNDTASSSSVPFVVQIDTTSLALSLAKVAGGIRATATLTDADDGGAVAGTTISFSVDGSPAGSATTAQNGQASRVLKLKRGQTVSASFSGDQTYGSSSAQQTYR